MITLALANRLLDSVLRPGPVFVSLHTNEPGEDGGFEIFGEGYARQAVTFERALQRIALNDLRAEFRDMPVSQVTHIGIWDARDGGVFLWGSDRIEDLPAVPRGGTVRINPGDLAIKMLIR